MRKSGCMENDMIFPHKTQKNNFVKIKKIMLFNSIEFALFLPVVFFLYWFVFNRNLRLQNRGGSGLLMQLAEYKEFTPPPQNLLKQY